MKENNKLFKNQRDQTDFFIAIGVIALFLWLLLGTTLFGKTGEKFQSALGTIEAVADYDGDGIIDSEDDCPTLYSLSKNGCPIDSDNDGVVDVNDDCPDVMGLKRTNGCPLEDDSEDYYTDTDGDGILDADDECPGIKALTATGCPKDSDKDGIADAVDECPNKFGPRKNGGCPIVNDKDGDGIMDKDDECPMEAGSIDNNGCPIISDSDNDGVNDEDDQCPLTPGVAANNGCPADSDNDGIIDSNDRCPDQAGIASNQGCPELKMEEEDLAIIEDAIKNVQFELASDQLRSTSLVVLDRVVSLLNKYPETNLKIEGHTDNQGDDAENMALSKARAESAKNYLVSKNISNSRISTEGYGETQPIATNETAAGRLKNRRVEFDLNY